MTFYCLKSSKQYKTTVIFVFISVASVVIYICFVLLSIDEDAQQNLNVHLSVTTVIVGDQIIDPSVNKSRHELNIDNKNDLISVNLFTKDLTCEIKQYPKPIPYTQDGMF